MIYCNEHIHEELKNMKDSICFFCDQILVEVNKFVESCCSEQDMKKINGMNVCINCGSVHGYDYVNKYIDFYNDRYRIKRKSVYHRKYHISNVINDIIQKNDIQVDYYNREKILRIFELIDTVITKVNIGRKRLISINFILKQLFDILKIKYKSIPITKSKKTLEDYENWWKQVYVLIKNDIKRLNK